MALWLLALVLGATGHSCPERGCRAQQHGPTLLQLQAREARAEAQQAKLVRTSRAHDFLLLENNEGNCLEASNAGYNGVRPTMQACDSDNFLQNWEYDNETGLLRHAGGKCLDASQRSILAGLIHLWTCDASNENQMWDWDPDTGRIKNRYGICMDAPSPLSEGTNIHMWTCIDGLSNQQWHSVPAGVRNFTTAEPQTTTTTATTTATSTSTSTASPTATSPSTSAATSTSESPSTSETAAPTTTQTTTPQPLTPLRNCQLEPLVEGSGCHRLEVFEGDVFDIGENGQETAGRHACLKKLRLTEEADTFVHSLGRCELWHCGTLARVRMSAGPGGGLSESPYAIAIKTALGRYLTAAEDGTMRADEQAFVPEALFLLMPGSGGRFVLKAQNGRYLKAEPGGHLAAVTDSWDDWEEFEIVEQDAGKVALRTFHDTYVSANQDGFVSSGGYSATPETMLELVNRSRASWVNSSDLVQFHKTMSDASSHAVCSRPGEQAAVRCCSDEGVAPEDTYGCHARKNFSEAAAICQQSGLQLCTESQISVCPGCTCGFENQQIWTSTACEGTEGLTQRRLSQRNDRAAVFSSFCGYQPGKGGLHGEEVRSTVFVKLMEWNYKDIAQECTEYLAPNGFDAVQVAPVTEHVLGYQWWVKYQPVSAGLDTRSGTEEDFRAMVATCRAAGVQVIVDILMNHMAAPCRQARKMKHKKANWTAESDMPCVGWGGSRYGNRMQQGAKGWDAASPRHFHHKKDDAMEPWCQAAEGTRVVRMWKVFVGKTKIHQCSRAVAFIFKFAALLRQVGPQTGYALPDFATELEEVREMQVKHLEDLFHIGVTALRVDAAIYHHVYELAAMVNRLPWDLVYQEWWGEYPPHDRTEYVGLYRDVAYRWHLVNRLAGKNATELPELLQLESGVFGITQDMAVYPFAYHDGRSKNSDPEIATYKNGLAFHQQQKFFLSWPFGEKVLIWGGYG
ncbi:amy, partial [Symbiodinium sp. KB8]